MSGRTAQTIEVVAGLIFRDGRLLACQRSATGPFPFKWEFPGGKLEEGEDYVMALRRELREELGIEVRTATEFHRETHSYSGFSRVNLRFFLIKNYTGEVTNRIFYQIRWVPIHQLEELDFLEADRPIIKKIAHAPLTS